MTNKVHLIQTRPPGDTGETGNQGTKGELRKLQRLFDGELLKSFAQYGPEVIDQLRKLDPVEYVKVISRRLPAAVDVDGGVEIVIRHFAAGESSDGSR